MLLYTAFIHIFAYVFSVLNIFQSLYDTATSDRKKRLSGNGASKSFKSKKRSAAKELFASRDAKAKNANVQSK